MCRLANRLRWRVSELEESISKQQKKINELENKIIKLETKESIYKKYFMEYSRLFYKF